MAAHSDENDEENMEYIYDEVYFCTTSTREEIESDLEYYWKSGQEWNPSIPESDKQKIERLEQELSETKEQMTKNQLASDMTIAELTMVMADMMGGGEENV
jgi:Zn-dependent oligopeptidase